MKFSLKKDQKFAPTHAMTHYAYYRAKLGNEATNLAVAAAMGMDSAVISRWKKIPGFNEWLEEKVIEYRLPIIEFLDSIAKNKAPEDHRYFQSMAERYGYSTQQTSSQKEQHVYPALTKEQALELLKQQQGDVANGKEDEQGTDQDRQGDARIQIGDTKVIERTEGDKPEASESNSVVGSQTGGSEDSSSTGEEKKKD